MTFQGEQQLKKLEEISDGIGELNKSLSYMIGRLVTKTETEDLKKEGEGVIIPDGSIIIEIITLQVINEAFESLLTRFKHLESASVPLRKASKDESVNTIRLARQMINDTLWEQTGTVISDYNDKQGKVIK